MFYYVLFVLFATALLLGYFVFCGKELKYINEIGYERARRFFVLFGMVFMIISLIVSKVTQESLAFSLFGSSFDEEYSTLIWAVFYFLVLYVSIFEEFHLNGWITSKSKSWKQIDETQLNSINKLVIKDVLEGKLEKDKIFYNAISLLNTMQEDLVMIGIAKTDLFSKEYGGIYYHCKDKRINMFIDGITDIINLKSN